MKNRFLSLLSALMLFSAVVVLNSCSKDDEVPGNVIEDADGVTVELEWTTGGSEANSLLDYDLDLYILDEDGDLALSSADADEFELIEGSIFELLPDGEYTAAVYVYDVDTTDDADFTLTVNGESVNKPQTFEGSVSSSDDSERFEVATIIKSGNKYTINEK